MSCGTGERAPSVPGGAGRLRVVPRSPLAVPGSGVAVRGVKEDELSGPKGESMVRRMRAAAAAICSGVIDMVEGERASFVRAG